MDLRDLKTFLHLAESRHFGRSARAMHVSPSTLSRQIQRLEEDLGQPLFVRDNRTVTLTEAGEELRTFAQQTLLQYQQLRHTIDQQGPSLSGELHIFCSVTAAYSHLPPILDRFRAEHPSVEIKLTTGDAADAMEKVVTGEADLAIAGKPETLPGAVAFAMLENLAVVLIAPARGRSLTGQRYPLSWPTRAPCAAALSCGFVAIKSVIHQFTRRWADMKPWYPWWRSAAASRCCRKWCWKIARSRCAIA